jgi:predicted acetyltransferase
MCNTSVPANVPGETIASPHSVATRCGPEDSNPGSAYVPEPVMIPIGMAGQHKLRRMDPAPITAEEIPEFRDAVGSAFHNDTSEHHLERMRKTLEPERTLVLRDNGRIVAGTGIYTRRLSVPGGDVPVAGVTQVGVRPTHRRRGMLTALMRRQLDDVHDAGDEAVAALWASESVIYGRFGYGLATLAADLVVTTRDARLRTLPEPADVQLMPAPEGVDLMRPIHDAARAERPGMLDREGPWWDFRIDDPESDRDGAQALRAAVIEGSAYALYAGKLKFEEGQVAGDARVREVVATTPEGYAAIWNFLLELDLVRRVVYELAPADDPLPHMVTEARAVRVTMVGEALWVRLVDLPRALRERTYGQPFEVVFEVADEFCPWNAGRWALRWDGETATCAPTALPAAIELGVAELGAAYLGGTTLDELARARRLRELRTGALAATSRAFRGDRAPWCPEIF